MDQKLPESAAKGYARLKIQEGQLKNILRRLFNTIDIKGRDALDMEEFREMLIFVKEDIFINKEHRYGEWEKDQSVFKRIWDSFEKTQIKVVPGENIVMQ